MEIAQKEIEKMMNDPDRELVAIVRCKDCRHYPGGRIADEFGFKCPIAAHKLMFKHSFCDCGETKAEYCKRNGRKSYDSDIEYGVKDE